MFLQKDTVIFWCVYKKFEDFFSAVFHFTYFNLHCIFNFCDLNVKASIDLFKWVVVILSHPCMSYEWGIVGSLQLTSLQVPYMSSFNIYIPKLDFSLFSVNFVGWYPFDQTFNFYYELFCLVFFWGGGRGESQDYILRFWPYDWPYKSNCYPLSH